MERITQLTAANFWEFFNNPLNHRLTDNQKQILLKLKDAVVLKEEALLTAEADAIVNETEHYQKD